MTTLLLVRHGETDWNAERRWQGHADVPLNARGRDQAERLAEQLAGDSIAAIYTSDLIRARTTADVLGARLGVPVVADPALREIHVGSREGLTWEQIGEHEWDGEATEAHAARILGAIGRIAERHPDERVLVVTHGGSMRRVHEHLGVELGFLDNCAVWACVHEGGALRAID